jgi:pimeloyl-ACP methyl ester carboxylesterase
MTWPVALFSRLQYKLAIMPVVQSAGVSIHYEVIGQGPPIVLVHGFTGSLEIIGRQNGWIDFLVAQGRTVVGLDCRGHGSSGKPHDPGAYGRHQMPDDVIAVMDAADVERADLMGYSMGGSIATNLLGRYPARFSSVVVGGAGLPSGPVDRKRRAAIAAALETDDVSTITNPTALAMRQSAESRGNDLHALGAMQRSEPITQADDEKTLRQVQVPILVIVGEKDPLLGAAKSLAETVPDAELVVLPNEDHASALLAQGCKEAVAAFLKTTR